MNKKLLFVTILFVIGVFMTACGSTAGQTPVQNQPEGIHQISAVLQATEQPPVLPTIVINPTPAPAGSGGSATSMGNLLIYVLIGAIILIALIAVLRKS